MFLKDILFPKICVCCSYLGSYICFNCQKKLKYIEQEICFICKKPSPFGLIHFSCKKKYHPEGIMSIFYYNNVLKNIIKTVKYHLAIEVFKELFQVINSKKIEKISFFANFKNVVFQPIPLYQNREKQRGFNQAKILISFFYNFLPFSEIDCLIRKKETKPQAEIKSRRDRYLNVKNAFSVKPQVEIDENKVIILVDDVITTGMTVLEAVKTLKKAGFKKVFVLSLARA